LRPFFWEYNFRALSWANDRDLIVSRILSSGTWKAVGWLRSRLGDAELAEWITHRHGRGLSRKQLRFWELILKLPHRQVELWLATGDQTFGRRCCER
jgi:hypothetical protein